MIKYKRLLDAYRFPGFKPQQEVVGVFGDPKARVIRLKRVGKKLVVQNAVRRIVASMTAKCVG